MNLFERLTVTRAIAAIDGLRTDDDARKRAQNKVEQAGASAVPKLIEALDNSRNSDALIALLARVLTTESLPHVTKPLLEGPPEVADAVIAVLGKPSTRWDPNKLLPLFLDPDCRYKTVLAHALARQGSRVKAEQLIEMLDDLLPEDRAPVGWLLGQVATEKMATRLANRLLRDDEVASDLAVRRALIGALGRLGGAKSRQALIDLLDSDPRPEVRLTLLDALVANGKPPIRALCKRLRDGDMRVQSRAQDILSGLDEPEVVHRVAELLGDDSVETRRAAVEILNRKKDASVLPALLKALEDGDWWVRSRAADAVADRADASLIPTVLPMVGRADDAAREELLGLVERLAGERSLATVLLPMLERSESSIRRGAVATLGVLGGAPAVEPLVGMLRDEGASEIFSDVVSALTELGDARAIDPLLERLESAQLEEQAQVIEALGVVADAERASLVAERISRATGRRDSEALRIRAEQVVESLRERFGDLESPQATSGKRPSKDASREISRPTMVTEPPAERPSVGDTVIDINNPPAEAQPIDFNPLAFKPGQRLGDRYRVLRQVGRGGFGVVVLTEDEMVGEQLILKFLAPHLAQDANAIERFKHEIRYARRITHENVIRIYDLIALEGVFAIAMEFFESHSLSAELRHEPRLPLLYGLKVLRQVCRGLAEAHRVSVIHRDLKPGNILIDDQEFVKIVDFGLAAAATHDASRLTRSGLLLGTPTYMAPEQIEGQELDHRADIYSLGVLMYEVFTGRVPFEGANAVATLFQHLDARVVAPRAVVPSLPEALETVILKAMSRAPEARYQTAEELGTELDTLYDQVKG